MSLLAPVVACLAFAAADPPRLHGLRGEIAVAGHHAFLAAESGVIVADVGVAGAIPWVAEVALPGEMRGVTLVDADAPVPVVVAAVAGLDAGGRDGIVLIEARPPGGELVGVALADSGEALFEPAVAGDLVLVRTTTGFVVFDIAEPWRPRLRGTYDALQHGAYEVTDVVGRDGAAYVLVRSGGDALQVVDLADPDDPVLARSLLDHYQIGLDGSLALEPHLPLLAMVAGYGTETPLYQLRLDDPLNPTIVGQWTVSGRGTLSLRAPLLAGSFVTTSDTPPYRLATYTAGSDTAVSAISAEDEASRVALLGGDRALLYSRGATALGDQGHEHLRIWETIPPERSADFPVRISLGRETTAYAVDLPHDSLAVVAYLTREDSFVVAAVDLGDPARPLLGGSWTSAWEADPSARKALAFRSDGIGVASEGVHLHVLDVSSPAAVEHVATLDSAGGELAAIEGDLAVVAVAAIRGGGHYCGEVVLRVSTVDLADPHAPRLLGEVEMPVTDDPYECWDALDAVGLELREGHAWLLGRAYRNEANGGQHGRSAIASVDLATPEAPALVEITALELNCNDLALSDSLLLTAGGNTRGGAAALVVRRLSEEQGRSEPVAVWDYQASAGPIFPDVRLLVTPLAQVLAKRITLPAHQIDLFHPQAPADLGPVTLLRPAAGWGDAYGELAPLGDRYVVDASGDGFEVHHLQESLPGAPGAPRLVAARAWAPTSATARESAGISQR